MSVSSARFARLKSNKASSLAALGLIVGGVIGTIGMITPEPNTPVEVTSTEAPGSTAETATSSSETVRLWIGPETTTCSDWHADYECPLMRVEGDATWSGVFGGDIEGLDYELGVEYIVDAELQQRDPAIMDVGSSYYEVVRLIEEGS